MNRLEERDGRRVVERERSRRSFEKEDSERLERRRVKESRGERRFSSFKKMSEFLKDSHLMDEFVDERDIRFSSKTYASVECVGWLFLVFTKVHVGFWCWSWWWRWFYGSH